MGPKTSWPTHVRAYNMSRLESITLGVFLLNLPFGFWRAGVRRFTLPWFLAVHVPVPIVVGLRIFGGLGWQLFTFPWMVSAFFAGQFLGGKLHRWCKKRG